MVIDWRDAGFIERSRAIFRSEFDSFLPDRIIDAHVHISQAGLYPPAEPNNSGGVPLTRFDYDDLKFGFKTFLPNRSTGAICFGSPNVSLDNTANNRYVAENAPDGFYPFRLLDPVKDTEKILRADIETYGFIGLKPYLTFVRKKNEDDVEISEMLPDWAMRVADEKRLLITLHIPRKQRFADPLNRAQIERLARSYPNATLLIAHIGRAYFYQNIVGSLDNLIDLPNVYLELAMVQNADVLEYCFSRFPLDRIIYATDAPIAFAPGASVEINNQYSYITPNEWKLAIHDAKPRIEYTSFMYEELRAIKKAAVRSRLKESVIEDLFYRTTLQLVSR